MKHELRIMVFALIALFIIHYSLFIIHPTRAQDEGLGQSQITPASPLYFLKAVREILELKFAGTQRVKIVRELEFSTRRIREVKGLVETSHQDLIEPTLARYLAQLQQFNGVVNYNNEVLAAQLVEYTSLHMSALQTVYPQVSNSRARMSIRTTIYRLTIWEKESIEKLHTLSKPYLAEKLALSMLSGCSFLSKEASSSASVKSGFVLNEVEKAVLYQRAQKCLILNP